MQYEVFLQVFSQEAQEDEEITDSSWLQTTRVRFLISRSCQGWAEEGKGLKTHISKLCCLLGSLEKYLARESLELLTNMKCLDWSVNFYSFWTICVLYLRWQEVKHHFDILILKIPEGSQRQNMGTSWRTVEIMNGLPIIYLHAFLVFMTFVTFLFILGDDCLLAWWQSLGVKRMNHTVMKMLFKICIFWTFIKYFAESCFPCKGVFIS